MKGLTLSSLTGELYKVEQEYEQNPVQTIENIDGKTHPAWKGENRYPFLSDYHRLPLEAFQGFSFDELCKLNYSSTFCMNTSVETLFETDAKYEIVRKIMSSMWRWGCGRGTWNEVVDAYEHIRHFTFGDNPDFEIRLDHTTGYNEFGYAKYSRIFIDGVFAFLVYYKREHVMTIGFSIMEKKSILLQQVQSAKRSGNRYLYRLPHNRLEFILELFRANFPGYTLYVIDGKCLAKKTLADYRDSLKLKWLDECQRVAVENRITHLKADSERLASFYRNTGKFTLGKVKKVNNLIHYCVGT